MSSVQRAQPQTLSARQGYPASERARARPLNDVQEEEEDSEEINRLFPKCTPKSTPTNTPSSSKANRTLSDSLQQAEKKTKKKKKKKKGTSTVGGKKSASSKEPLVIVDKIIDLDDDSEAPNCGSVSYQCNESVVVPPNMFRHDVHKMLSPTSTYPQRSESITPLQQSTRIPSTDAFDSGAAVGTEGSSVSSEAQLCDTKIEIAGELFL
jgi:hypothetical protein